MEFRGNGGYQRPSSSSSSFSGNRLGVSGGNSATSARDIILQYIKTNGPSLPAQIARQIGKDTMITGAMLSELSSKKHVVLSYLKVGGSPLYYLPGQEAQLVDFKEKLHQREQETLEYLMSELVVKDIDLQPVQRVSIREIRDFAIPITVTLGEREELFWKWYLAADDEVRERVMRLIPKQTVPSTRETATESSGDSSESIKQAEQAAENLQQMQENREESVQKKAQERGRAVESSETKLDARKETQASIPAQIDEKDLKDAFFKQIVSFCEANKITIIEYDIIRKGGEIDLVLRVPSAVGPLKYYAKAKAKKTCNDTDLAGAFVEAQTRRLPALFLAKGKITKKAQEKLEKDFQGLIVKDL